MWDCGGVGTLPERMRTFRMLGAVRLEGEMTTPVPSLQDRPLVAGHRRGTLIGAVALVGAGSVLGVIGLAFREVHAGAGQGRRRSGSTVHGGARDVPLAVAVRAMA